VFVRGIECRVLEAVMREHAAHALAQRQSLGEIVPVAQVVECVVVDLRHIVAVDVHRQQFAMGATEQQNAQAARDAGCPGSEGVVTPGHPVPGQVCENHIGSKR